MVAGVIGTGAHPKALWPGVREWFGRSYLEHAEEWRDIVHVESSSQNYEEGVQITPFGLVPIKAQGQSSAYDSEIQGYTTRLTHLTYSLGYIVTQEELEDNLYDKVSKTRAAALAFSFHQTREVVVANLLNRAFNATYLGGDGVALCSTVHPNTTGGTWSNMLATGADLSEAALEDMIIQMMGATDDRGNLISLNPESLHIARQEWYNANRIYKSVFQSDSASNNINVLKATNSIPKGIKMNHFLTSPHAWFLKSNITPSQGLVLYERIPLAFTQDNDFDTDNAKAKGRERFSVGWYDSHCIFGSNGP
jgi:hypothetical protein